MEFCKILDNKFFILYYCKIDTDHGKETICVFKRL